MGVGSSNVSAYTNNPMIVELLSKLRADLYFFERNQLCSYDIESIDLVGNILSRSILTIKNTLKNNDNDTNQLLDLYFTIKEIFKAIYRAKSKQELIKNIELFFAEREQALQGDTLDYCLIDSPANMFCEKLALLTFPDKTIENCLFQKTLSENRKTPWENVLIGGINLPKKHEFFRSERGNIEPYEQIIMRAIVKIKENRVDLDEIWLGCDHNARYALSKNDRFILKNRSETFNQLIQYTEEQEKLSAIKNPMINRFIELRKKLLAGDENHQGTDKIAGDVAYRGIIEFSAWWRTLDKDLKDKISKIGKGLHNIGNILDLLYIRLSPDKYQEKYQLNCINGVGSFLDEALSDKHIVRKFYEIDNSIIAKTRLTHTELDLAHKRILSEIKSPLNNKIHAKNNLFMSVFLVQHKLPDFKRISPLLDYTDLKIMENIYNNKIDGWISLPIEKISEKIKLMLEIGFAEEKIHTYFIKVFKHLMLHRTAEEISFLLKDHSKIIYANSNMLIFFSQQQRWDNVLTYVAANPKQKSAIDELLAESIKQGKDQIAVELIDKHHAQLNNIDFIIKIFDKPEGEKYLRSYLIKGDHNSLIDLTKNFIAQQDKNKSNNQRDNTYKFLNSLILHLKDPLLIIELINKAFNAQKTNNILVKRRGHFSSAWHSHQWHGEKVSTQWVELVQKAKNKIKFMLSSSKNAHYFDQNPAAIDIVNDFFQQRTTGSIMNCLFSHKAQNPAPLIQDNLIERSEHVAKNLI